MRLPSSTSEAEAEQLRVLPTTTPELGEMLALPMEGAVFSTVTDAVDVAVAALESVAVAVQVMVDPTSVSAADTV